MKVKIKWIRPRLIVLVRARFEENVLLACKGSFLAGPQRPGGWACTHPAHGPCQSQANS
jgi:hypothetical protein